MSHNVLFLVIISVFFLVLFGILNNTGSENIAMVRIFEPDEAAVLPVIQDMVTPKANLDSFLRGFDFLNITFMDSLSLDYRDWSLCLFNGLVNRKTFKRSHWHYVR